MYSHPGHTRRPPCVSPGGQNGLSVDGRLSSIPSNIQVLDRGDPSRSQFDSEYQYHQYLHSSFPRGRPALDPRFDNFDQVPWPTYPHMLHPSEVARQRSNYYSNGGHMISPDAYPSGYPRSRNFPIPSAHFRHESLPLTYEHVSIHDDLGSVAPSLSNHPMTIDPAVVSSGNTVSLPSGWESQIGGSPMPDPRSVSHHSTEISHGGLSVHSVGIAPQEHPSTYDGMSVHSGGFIPPVENPSYHEGGGFIPPVENPSCHEGVSASSASPLPQSAMHSLGREQNVRLDLGDLPYVRPYTTNVLQTEKKLTFSAFDGVKPAFAEWFMKVQNQMMKTNQDYLLRETETTALNSRDSKAVAIELFDKLTGAAHNLFSSLKNHRYYVLGGRGIEMLHLLTRKFNPLDMDAVGEMLTELQSLQLLDTEDLSVLINKVDDICCRLAMVNQNPPESFMVHHVQNVLKTSRYGPELIVLLRTHAANRTAFRTIDELVVALHRMDKVNGRDYGGQAFKSEPKVKFGPGVGGTPGGKPLKEQFVSSVISPPGDTVTTGLTHDWMGARDLTDEQIKTIRANQQCHLCRTDKHPWTKCAKLLAKFDIIKKDIPEKESPKTKEPAKETEKGKASAVATPLPSIAENNRFSPLEGGDEDSFEEVIVDVLDNTFPSLLTGAVSSVYP
jgi:hypothetical protein